MSSLEDPEGQARPLGILEYPQTTLFTQPRYVYAQQHRLGLSPRNCLIDRVEQLFRAKDATTSVTVAGYSSPIAALLAPQWGAFVKIITKHRGFHGEPTNNYARIDIWTSDYQTRLVVTRLVQAQDGDPVWYGIDWNALEKVWHIQREAAITDWHRFVPSLARLPTETLPPRVEQARFPSGTRVEDLEWQAQSLGILLKAKATLFTQPRHVYTQRRGLRANRRNCLIDGVEQLFRVRDSKTVVKFLDSRDSLTVALLAPKWRAFAELVTKFPGSSAVSPGTSCTRVVIWGSADQIRLVARRLVRVQDGDPIETGIDWERIEAVWDILREAAIAEWRRVLPSFKAWASTSPPARIPPQKTPLTSRTFDGNAPRRCTCCGAQLPPYALFCEKCGFPVDEPEARSV